MQPSLLDILKHCEKKVINLTHPLKLIISGRSLLVLKEDSRIYNLQILINQCITKFSHSWINSQYHFFYSPSKKDLIIKDKVITTILLFNLRNFIFNNRFHTLKRFIIKYLFPHSHVLDFCLNLFFQI